MRAHRLARDDGVMDAWWWCVVRCDDAVVMTSPGVSGATGGSASICIGAWSAVPPGPRAPSPVSCRGLSDMASTMHTHARARARRVWCARGGEERLNGGKRPTPISRLRRCARVPSTRDGARRACRVRAAHGAAERELEGGVRTREERDSRRAATPRRSGTGSRPPKPDTNVTTRTQQRRAERRRTDAHKRAQNRRTYNRNDLPMRRAGRQTVSLRDPIPHRLRGPERSECYEPM